MIRISSTLHASAVCAQANCSNKHALLSKLAQMAAENYDLDIQIVLDGLTEREQLGSTGFGGGIAIPHTKIAGLTRPVGVFCRLEKPIPYDAVDEEPVDLIFCLISPANDGASHLRALAEVSRMLRDEKSCSRLRGADDSDAIFALLNMPEERDAA